MFNIRLSKKEPLPLYKSLSIRAIAILLSLIVCAIVIVSVTNLNPFEVYGGIINGALGTSRRLWVTIRDTLVLLLVAVGLIPAFKMKFWNIGAEGQMLMGAFASAALMIYCPNLPNAVLIPLIMVCSCLAGVIWGIIPAYFKAKYDTNETLFTLMMNYIAMQLISFSIVFWENPTGSNTVGLINPTTSRLTIKGNGISLLSTFSPSFNSLSRAQIPIIPKILKILLPITLLTARALLP